MSDRGSDEERDDEKEEEESPGQKYETVISALPPRVVQQEESQVEVSASPAFQCLDELFHEGKLTGTKVALLKAKYTELHETLKRTRESEANLLNTAKEHTIELERQRSELEKGDNFPDSSNTEVTKMRQQLMKHNNEYAQILEREYQQQYELETLSEEKKIMEREYSRMPKQWEIEKKLKEIQAASEDMKKEIVQRQMEAKTLREDMETTQRQCLAEQKEYDQLKSEMENLKGDLVQINTLPNQIAKEADKLHRQKLEVEKGLAKLEEEYQEILDESKTMESKKNVLQTEKFDTESELAKTRAMLDQKEREYNMLIKDFEFAKDREAVLMGDRSTLDISLRHTHLEKKNTHDVHSRKSREKDRDLRNLKKAELQFKVAEESLSHTKSVHEKVKGQIDSLPKDDGTLQKKREELAKEVEHTKRSLAQQNNLTAVEHVKLEASAAEEQNLLYDQSDLRIEVVELTRLAAIKADEREQKARDFMRAEMRFHKAIEDLKTKELQIQDHHKKHQEMQIKLKEFAKLYELIKNERNKCVNLIQTSTQKAAEMKEKIKILQNEMEILRTAVMQKDRELQKHRLKHMNSIVMRDSLRNEVAKQTNIYNDMKATVEQQKMDLNKLNNMMNAGEEESTRLRNRYSKEEQKRNDRGLKLIEREEEVCIFYEKVNIEEQMIRNGNVELQAKEEEIRFLKMQLNEENRSIELLRKNMPKKHALEQELVTLQIQLQQCQDRMLDLEKELENPYDETRVRQLEGKDLPPAELQDKIENLEMRLAEKEEHLLEKDLIFEQVTRLASRVKVKAEDGKDDTLGLAKNVNALQGKIKDAYRKMRGLVAELSMNTATALQLQQTLKEKEADLEQCYIRMEKGEPPCDEFERDWNRLMSIEDRIMRDKEENRLLQEEEEQYKIAGGTTTTADPRPNAYIPDDDSELPIPRPYGRHAPFKPTEPGSTMRHIRKPVPKPIEI
ncbi:coiled-coil domain-containing protein 146-like [Argopecten irradians]|uniref:coiled-coil domain-containing protein 146-like n=1 Tax=Argopecten irradians TaxID=31199 RepID=UPI00371FDC68